MGLLAQRVAFAAILVTTVLALALPALAVARRDTRPWARLLAGVLVVLAVDLLVFVLSEDDYTRDGRSNWTVYDVEYAAVPMILGLPLAAAWLLRHAGSRAVAFAAPWIAMVSAFGAVLCLFLTTN